MDRTYSISLSPSHFEGEERKYVDEAFSRREVGSFGLNLTVFERDLESYLKEDSHVVALSSGTSAIHLALIMARVSLNDEVLCQSFTFSASANPIRYQGANPVFIDSELETWNMQELRSRCF